MLRQFVTMFPTLYDGHRQSLPPESCLLKSFGFNDLIVLDRGCCSVGYQDCDGEDEEEVRLKREF